MATAFGVDGSLTFMTGHYAKFNRWGLQVTQGIVDETGYGDTWADIKGTNVKRAAWSAFGHPKYDVASANPGVGSIAAAGGSIVFQVATGCTYTFTGIISSANIASEQEGQATVAYVGSVSGAIVTVWDETP